MQHESKPINIVITSKPMTNYSTSLTKSISSAFEMFVRTKTTTTMRICSLFLCSLSIRTFEIDGKLQREWWTIFLFVPNDSSLRNTIQTLMIKIYAFVFVRCCPCHSDAFYTPKSKCILYTYEF